MAPSSHGALRKDRYGSSPFASRSKLHALAGILALGARREPQVIEASRSGEAVEIVPRRALVVLHLDEADAHPVAAAEIERHAAILSHVADAGDQHRGGA